MKYLRQILDIALRELNILRKNRIYGFCMIVFPVLLVIFFTTMLDDGIPQDLPIGVVDQDNSATSRGLVRNLDAMQNSRVVYRFANVTEARNAMQEGKVYAYLYIPEGTAAKLMAVTVPIPMNRKNPKVSSCRSTRPPARARTSASRHLAVCHRTRSTA